MLFSGVNMKAVQAPYKVTLRIAEAGKHHSIRMFLLLSAAKDIASSVLGEKAAKQPELVPLSNDTISRQISDMASNVKEQLIEKVKVSEYYSIQLDESTDVSNISHLFTFIKFEDGESVKKELLFCEPLLGCSNSNDIFKKLDHFMKVHGIEWEKNIWEFLRWSVCNDVKHS
jgi:hypothetical protein